MTAFNLAGNFKIVFAHMHDVVGATLLNDLNAVKHSCKDGC